MRSLLPVGVLGAILIAAGAARAADEALPEPLRLEREALVLESRLAYDEALDRYRRAFELALAEARASKESQRGSPAAWADVFAWKIDFFAGRTGRWRDLEATFEAARKAGVPPLLDARLADRIARARLARGDIAGAEAAVADLGFIDRFAICGPFDNERGGGFAQAYEPEEGATGGSGRIDLDARCRGKAREIGWVVPAKAAFLGEVDLDAMLRPNDEALAYALAYVKWDGEPRHAALRIGSDEGVKVWWNGREVLSRDVNRTIELDQDAAPVWLRKGWNQLLIKVAERKGAWAFRARLTDFAGKPLAFVAADEALLRAGVPAPEPSEPAGAAPQVARGAIDHYEAITQTRHATAHDFFHLGYLHYRRHAHDENEHPDREAFLEAVRRAPGDAIYHAYLSHVVSRSGEFSVNREENERRAELEKALALDPKAARAALLLAEYYFRSLRQPDRAEEYLERALAIAPESPEARLLEIDLHEARGFGGLARAGLRALAASETALRSGAVRQRLGGHAAREYRMAEAEAHARAALAIDFADADARDLLITILEGKGDVEGALAAHADEMKLRPFDIDVRSARARLLSGQDRFDEATAELEAALAIAPEDDGTIAELARLRLLAGDRDRAIALYERALELNPGLVDVRRHLELLKEDERPFEDEFRLDPEEAIAAAKKIPIDPRVSVRTLLENVVSKVNLDGTSSEFTQLVLRIENDDGVEEYDWAKVYYAVGEQRATVKRATVVKADGRREEARYDNYARERDAGEFTQYALKAIDLPPLEPGDIVILEHRVDDVKQSFFGDYFGKTHHFQGFEPVVRSRYVLVAPKGRELYFHARGLDPKGERRPGRTPDEVVTVWELRDLPRIEQEPDMPPYEEVAPCIQVSTFKDWNAFARWYWNLVRKQFEVSDEMRLKVDELMRGARTREDKIRAIYDFVVTDVRYNDKWEFGVHGFKPYNAASIFARRFGDCKDKATLICTMLSTVGIEAYPVLIDGQSRRGKEDLSLPLMTHFNHCIAYVPGPAPGGGDGWFLDGTAQDHEAENLPNMDWGATCLVVRPDGGELKRVKWPDPLEENGIKERWRVEVGDDGAATVQAEVEPKGVYATVVRGQFTNEADRKETLEKIYGRKYAGARVLAQEFGDLKNLREPVKVRFRMEVPGLARKVGGTWRLDEPRSVLFQWIYAETMSELATKSERKWDVVLPVPSGVEETAEYVLPQGFAPKHVPTDVNLEGEFGTFEKDYQLEGGVLRVTRRLVLKAQRIPAEKYGEWREWANQVDRADDERVTLTKDGMEQ